MKKVVATMVALSIAVSGCSTFAPKTQTVSAVCSEPDANLQINAPGVSGKSHHFLSGTGVADIIGTLFFLLPGIGLFTAGAWKLDETDVSLAMMKSEK